jgi:hypothetical protein
VGFRIFINDTPSAAGGGWNMLTGTTAVLDSPWPTQQTATVTVPSVPPGTYYVLWEVDPENQYNEFEEGDNVVHSYKRLNIVQDCSTYPPQSCSPHCGPGYSCNTDDDCYSQSCLDNHCMYPSCYPYCRAGIPCFSADDCASRVCTDDVCQIPECSPNCGLDSYCNSDADCLTKACGQLYKCTTSSSPSATVPAMPGLAVAALSVLLLSIGTAKVAQGKRRGRFRQT